MLSMRHLRQVELFHGLFGALLLWTHCVEVTAGVKCFTDIEAKQITDCKENQGYRTCFTKYNDKGQVIGRGCSTKDKVFFKECETHSYGDSVEKMCFCSFFLCNTSGGALRPDHVLMLALLSAVAAVFYGGRELGLPRRRAMPVQASRAVRMMKPPPVSLTQTPCDSLPQSVQQRGSAAASWTQRPGEQPVFKLKSSCQRPLPLGRAPDRVVSAH